jgi:hypothetical protein
MSVLARRASDVRINEVDMSATLTNASNATAAIVMVSGQGQVGPKFYSNADDFLFDFGNPKASVSFDHYAALDYFREGNSLWATRALGTGYAYAAGIIKLDATLNTLNESINAGVVNPASPDWDNLAAGGEIPLYLITANRGPGSYGNNIFWDIVSENLNAPSSLSGTSANVGGTLIAGSYTYVVSALGPAGETLSSSPVTVVIAGVATTNAVTLTWDAEPGAQGYNVYGRSGSTASLDLLAVVGGAEVSFVDDGVSVGDLTKHPIVNANALAAASPIFRVRVYDALGSLSNPVETFVCSTTEQVDETGAQMEMAQRINPFSRYISVHSNLPNLAGVPTLRSADIAQLTGGTSGTAPTSSSIISAWNRFTSKEVYRLDMLINAGRTSVAVQLAMDELATKRNDCVAYLDMPATSQKAQAAVDYRNLTLNLNSSYSVLATSDLLESDPITGKFLYIPPSGALAGLQARTTRIGQPWFSSAGLNRGLLRALDIREIYDDGAATLLYNANLAYIRKFVGRGIAFWEQNTLYNKNSALQFLNVRVLCNIIKRATYDYLIYGLQEQNDDILRRQLQFGLEDYLRAVQAGRGISSFRVVIDASNNPSALVNSGILAIAVIIVPIMAVREIQMSLVISKDGLKITEAEIAAL